MPPSPTSIIGTSVFLYNPPKSGVPAITLAALLHCCGNATTGHGLVAIPIVPGVSWNDCFLGSVVQAYFWRYARALTKICVVLTISV